MFIRTESFREFIRFYPVVTTIIAFQFVIWLLIYLRLSLGLEIYQWGVGVNYLVSEGQYWRLFTPIFLHDPFGIMHILFNSFSLVLFGPALEQMLGKIRFIAVYLLTGVFANLLTFVVDTSSTIQHLGASGAIYGLFGLYAYMIFFRKDLIDRANTQIIFVIIIIGLVMTFLRPGINIPGHVFGLIGGLALGPIALINTRPFSMYRRRRAPREGSVNFDPNRWQKRRIRANWAKPIIWIVIGILVLLGLFGRFL